MKTRSYAYSIASGIVIALLIGLIVALVMTFLDWRLNPGGIFRGDTGTDWARVAETAGSWFYPIAAAAGAVLVPVLLLFRFVTNRRTDSS